MYNVKFIHLCSGLVLIAGRKPFIAFDVYQKISEKGDGSVRGGKLRNQKETESLNEE